MSNNRKLAIIQPTFWTFFGLLFAIGISISSVSLAHAEDCQAPTPLPAQECGKGGCNPGEAQIAMYQASLAEYNTCVATNAETACTTNLPVHATQGYLDSSGQCTYNCASGYYLDVSGSCDLEGSSVVTPASASIATPTPAVVPATAAVVTQTVVTPLVAPPASIAKPKTIFPGITQTITQKVVPTAPAATVSATTTVSVVVEAAPQSTPKSVSFWRRVGSLFAKLNPFGWL